MTTSVFMLCHFLLENYRVSRKTLDLFVFWISRLPRGLEIPSWTFFNSPFRVDFKNIQVFIIWSNPDWVIGKILQRGHFKNQHLWLLLNKVTGHSWALRSDNELLWVLMSTCGYSGVLNSMLPWCHDCSWVLMRTHGTMEPCSRQLIRAEDGP